MLNEEEIEEVRKLVERSRPFNRTRDYTEGVLDAIAVILGEDMEPEDLL